MSFFERASADKDLIVKGRWWLPKTRTKITGTARVSVHDGCTLELAGVLPRTSGISLIQCDAVYGESFGGPISLLNCYETKLSGTESIIRADKVVTGIHVRSVKEATFDRVVVRLTHFDEWMYHGLFDLKESGVVRWDTNGVEWVYDVGSDKRFRFSSAVMSMRLQAIQTSVELREEGELEIKTKRLYTLEEMLGFVDKVRMLVSLGLQRPTYIEHMVGVSRNRRMRVREHVFPKTSDIYVQQMEREKTDRPGRLGDTLFVFERVEKWMKTVLENLINDYERFRPLFESQVAAFYLPRVYAEQRFLSLVIGLEQFHRGKYGGTIVSKKEWKPVFEALKNAVDTSTWAWLSQKVEHGNEVTLRTRLDDLLKRHVSALRDLYGDREYFVKKVSQTRNYLVHGSEKLRKQSASGAEMAYLIDRLGVVAEGCVLQGLGIPGEEVRDLFRKSVAWKYSKQAVMLWESRKKEEDAS